MIKVTSSTRLINSDKPSVLGYAVWQQAEDGNAFLLGEFATEQYALLFLNAVMEHGKVYLLSSGDRVLQCEKAG